jgi:transposase
MGMTDRSGRWITEQVGRYARSVNEVAVELGTDWHTINDTLIAYGTALVDDDPDRFGVVEALGLDEVLFCRIGPWRRQEFSTQIVDVGRGQLLDVVPGRSSAGPMAWLAEQGKPWRDQVRYATLDLSGPYRAVFDAMVPDATQVADPFHVVKSTNADAGYRTRPWATEATRPIRSTGAGGSSPRPTNVSTTTAGRSCSDYCGPETPRAT